MTGSNPVSRRHTSVLADLFLRNVKLSQVRALLLLYRHENPHAAAQATGESYNSLVAQIKALNHWFASNAHVELANADSGKLALTDNGRWIASMLGSVEPLLVTALEGLQSSSVALTVPCTSDCIDDLVRFIRRLSVAHISFAPFAVETAHFDPMQCGDVRQPVVSLGSKYMSGTTLALPDYVEALTLRKRPIVVISNEDPADTTALTFDQEQISLDELVAARVKILTSQGGVIWDFLHEHAPSVTEGLKNGTHVTVHDLHYGLKCLAARLVTRGTMLVHGVEDALREQAPRYPVLDNLRCYSLSESTTNENHAVTALFYNHRAAADCVPRVREAYEALWNAAHNGSTDR